MAKPPLDETIRHVRQHGGWCLLESYGLIRVAGPDATDFLQAQTTNDVKALAPGLGQLTAILDRKATIRVVFSLHQLAPDQYWLLCPRAQTQPLLEALEQVHFTESVTYEDITAHWSMALLQGPSTLSLIQAVAPNLDFSRLDQTHAITVLPAFQGLSESYWVTTPLLGEPGGLWILPTSEINRWRTEIAPVLESNVIHPITDTTFETLRLESGQLWYGIDYDETTPLTITGLQQSVVSYTKGCFPGQEVVAKVKTYGSAPKSIMGLCFDGDQTPSKGAHEMLLEQKSIGTLLSRGYSPTLGKFIAFAALNRDYRIPGLRLNFECEGTSYTATVQFLPFYQRLNAQEEAQQCYQEALTLFANNDEHGAETLFRRAVALDPNLADAYETLGVLLGRHEAYDEAISLMHQLAERQPDSVMAHTNLSLFYMKKGMKTEAEEEKAKATVLQFQQQIKHAQQQQAQAQQAQEKAKERETKMAMFKEVLAFDPEDTLAGYGLGRIYAELQQWPEAIACFEKVLSVDPQHSVTYVALAQALKSMGQLEKARNIIDTGISVASKRGDLMPLGDLQSLQAQWFGQD